MDKNKQDQQKKNPDHSKNPGGQGSDSKNPQRNK